MSSTEKPLQKRRNANTRVGWVMVRSIVTVILLVAAGFKVHQLATTPMFGGGLFEARWFQILLVECELALAVVLLVGIAPKITWLISTILFSIFTIVSLTKGLNGAESCGCFGVATINPWYTFVLDVGIVASLVIFRPTIVIFHWKVFSREFYRAWQSKRVVAVMIVYLMLAIPATYAMMSVESNNLAELGTEFTGADGKKTILLEPEKWVGKEFPLLPYIENDIHQRQSAFDEINIKRGNWNFLLYKPGCHDCIKTIEKMLDDKASNFICINISPSVDQMILSNDCLKLQLCDSKYHWFVQTPLLVAVCEGKCIGYD